jgi:hypothetical protein
MTYDGTEGEEIFEPASFDKALPYLVKPSFPNAGPL